MSERRGTDKPSCAPSGAAIIVKINRTDLPLRCYHPQSLIGIDVKRDVPARYVLLNALATAFTPVTVPPETLRLNPWNRLQLP